MKHIKTFEAFVNEGKGEAIDESLSDIAVKLLIGILALGVGTVAKFTAGAIIDRVTDGISNIADSIRKIINPTDLEEFTKIIETIPNSTKIF